MSHEDPNNWKQLHEEADIVDLHAHPSLKVSLLGRILGVRWNAARSTNPFSVRTDFPKMQQGNLDVLLSTVYVPERGIFNECHAVKILKVIKPRTWRKIFKLPAITTTLEMIKEMEDAVDKANRKSDKPVARMIYSVKELDNLLSQPLPRPIGVIHNVEGGHSLSGELKNVDELFNRGVAYLTVAHFYENEIVHPTFPYPESAQILGCFRGTRNVALGLKRPFGEKVIERMAELGMMIDVSHCTPPARKSIYEIVGENSIPIFASHLGAYEINPSPYNLKDWEIEQIAKTGGVVGVIFMNYWLMPNETKRGINFIAKTINHVVNVAGIEAVAIGTDFDGFTDPPDDLKDMGGLVNLTQRLIAEDYSAEDIKMILGGNAIKMLRKGWGKKE
jgi:membrane dipeptidase